MISTNTKVNMSLDEIQYIEKLEIENNILKDNNNLLKNKYNNLEDKFNKLNYDYNRLKENLEVLELEDWIIHNTYNNNEYVSGYLVSEKKMWDTSNILSKTATKYGLFVITQTEHIYYLPYNESYINN